MSGNYRFYYLNYGSSQLLRYRWGFDLETSATGLVVGNRLIVSSFIQKGGGRTPKKKGFTYSPQTHRASHNVSKKIKGGRVN
jgi:hypothetical protein